MAELAPKRSWAVIPAHNRRALTLGCLHHLHAIGALEWLRICVVDDGSSDGTAEAVRDQFPSATLLRGDGTLWWSGAVARGMATALDDTGCEALFWLNDDCRPGAGALERLRTEALAGPRIAIAQISTPGGIRFGGLRKTWLGLELAVCGEHDAMSVDTMNGNCVCLPTSIARRVGPPDVAHFPQAFGDADFGLRCRAIGIDLVVVGAAVCRDVEPDDRDKDSWLRGQRPIAEIWRSFRSRRNYFFPPPWWQFNRRHWGSWGAVLFTWPYLRFAVIALVRAVLPERLRRRWFAPQPAAAPAPR